VLGVVVTELDAQGAKSTGYVYAGGEVVAKQYVWGGERVEWRHANPVTGSHATSDVNRHGGVEAELDPSGTDVGLSDPFVLFDPGYVEPETPALLALNGGGWGGNCTLDGMRMDCADVSHMMEMGTAVQAPVFTTVRVTYTDGRAPQSFSGYTSLPAGVDLRFTGSHAQAAARGFNVGNMLGGLGTTGYSRFETGVRASIDFGSASRASLGADGGRAGGSPGVDWRSLASSFVQSAPQIDVTPRINFIGQRGTITQRKKGTILDVLNSIVNSEACNEAFMLAGLESPSSYFQRAGLTIGPASLLASSTNNKALGISNDKDRARIYDKIKEGIFYVGGSAVTLTGGGIPTPRVLFTANAFAPKYYDFRTELIHELMHVLGRQANPNATPHDLGDFNQFDDIQLACGGKPLNNLPR
jgi:hypothetical protein